MVRRVAVRALVLLLCLTATAGCVTRHAEPHAPDGDSVEPSARAEADPARVRLEALRAELERRLAAHVARDRAPHEALAADAGGPSPDTKVPARWNDELALHVALRSLDEKLAAQDKSRALGVAVPPPEGTADGDVADALASARRQVQHSRERQFEHAREEAERLDALQARMSVARDERMRAELMRQLERVQRERDEDEGGHGRRFPTSTATAGDVPDEPPAAASPDPKPEEQHTRCAAGDPLCDDGSAGFAGAIGAATVVGNASAPSGLMPAVERTLERMTGCFPPDALASGGLELRVRARVGTDGGMHEIRVTSDAELPAVVEACVVAVLATVRAGPQIASTVIAFPLWLR